MLLRTRAAWPQSTPQAKPRHGGKPSLPAAGSRILRNTRHYRKPPLLTSLGSERSGKLRGRTAHTTDTAPPVPFLVPDMRGVRSSATEAAADDHQVLTRKLTVRFVKVRLMIASRCRTTRARHISTARAGVAWPRE